MEPLHIAVWVCSILSFGAGIGTILWKSGKDTGTIHATLQGIKDDIKRQNGVDKKIEDSVAAVVCTKLDKSVFDRFEARTEKTQDAIFTQLRSIDDKITNAFRS